MVSRNEADTRAELIDPKLKADGWGKVADSFIRREVICPGRILTGGKRGDKVASDYVLVYKGRKLAAVEAKREGLSYTEGVRQAKDYAQRLQCRMAYATNGHELYQIDMLTGEAGLVDDYLSPQALWALTFDEQDIQAPEFKAIWRDRFSAIPFECKGDWTPRYYQENAINNALEAIAEGKPRILLTLATGTGKTCIAFQIAWKLFHSRWSLSAQTQPDNAKRRPRILFLADRNILANQALNDFAPFGDDAIVRIEPSEIKKKGRVPKNASVFFTIFQTFMASAPSAPFGKLRNRSGTEIEEPVPESINSVADRFLSLQKGGEAEITEAANGYMYILRCADDSFYVGSTRNLEYRLEQHKAGKGANHTKTRLPVKLVYYETFERIGKAFAREKQIQKWSRAKKFALIAGDIERLKALASTPSSPSAGSGTDDSVDSVPEPVEGGEAFGEYPADFFDFIIIDECHRGGANDESNWRAILDYFSPALQLGLTATPKRKDNVDTYGYFGEPVYSYTLKQGVNDGFLTPFKVYPIVGTMDEYIYTPGDGVVVQGEPEAGRLYKEGDFNRIITIPVREERRVHYWMERINPNDKTLVFCATQAHAGVVRDFINQTAVKKGWTTNSNYCVRVTANDGAAGENDLKIFRDNEKIIPTILTTSRKLSTGVDARNIRNIVLMRPCNNMIEFKQIIGRGTRMYDGKEFFTIFDFVKAHYNFADPEWDGEPLPPELCTVCNNAPCTCATEPCAVCGFNPCNCPKLCPICEAEPCTCQPKICSVCGVTPCNCEPVECSECASTPCVCNKVEKIVIKLSDGKTRQIQHISSVMYWSPEGKPITAKEFLERMFDDLPRFFENEDKLREIWSDPDTREKLLHDLAEAGYDNEKLDSMKALIDAQESDVYDVLAYVAYAAETRSRNQRAEQAKPAINQHYTEYHQQAFIEFILNRYIDEGVTELSVGKMKSMIELKYNTISDAALEFGSAKVIREVFVGFQQYLYRD